MVRASASLLLVCLIVHGQTAAPVKPAKTVRVKPGAARASSAKSAGPPAAAGAAASRPLPRLPIANLKVSGNRTFSAEQILAVSGLKAGDTAAQAEFDAARERLQGTGFFDSVGYRFDPTAGGKAYTAVFEVKEIDQLYPFRFESLHIDEKALVEELRRTQPLFADKLPPTQQTLDSIVRAIQAFMAKNGRPDMKVVARVATLDRGKLEIVFQPDRLPAVAEVDFKGNTLFPTARLREAVSAAAIGSAFTESRFREVLDASVRPLYESKGRLKVSFPKLEVVPAKGVSGLAVTVAIEEGDEFELRSVAFSEKPENDSPLNPSLLKEGKFPVGEMANMARVTEGVSAIEQSLRRKGYLEVKSKLTRQLDEPKKALDLKLDLDPGPQFTFRKLTIQGLDIETEPHIRKLWAMKLGQPFNSEYPDFFLNRIREDGIFDNLGRTKSLVQPDPGTGSVDVTLVFEGEKRPPKKQEP